MNLAQVLAQQGYAGNDPFPSNVRQPQPDELATALAKLGPANMAGNAGWAGDTAYLAGALANKFFTPWMGMPSYEETPGTTDYIGLATGQDIHSPEFIAGSAASFGPPAKLIAALGDAAPAIFAGMRSLFPAKDAPMVTSHGVRTGNELAAALAKAQDMNADGVPPPQIWEETGWFQGADNKWRYELDDSAGNFGLTGLQKSEVGQYVGRAPEAYSGTDVFKAYPDMEAMEVHGTRYPDALGKYHHRSGDSRFFPDGVVGVNDNLSHKQGRSTAFHEMQHAVQDREGFNRGGMPSANKQISPRYREWQEMQTDELVREYFDVHDSQQYAQELAEQNRVWKEDFEPKYDALHEQWKALGRGPSPEKDKIQQQMKQVFRDAEKATQTPYMDDAQKLYDKIRGKYGQAPSRTPPDMFMSPNEYYRHLAGEVEARNVQKRLDMTPDERRANFPVWTEDILREDQIVEFAPSSVITPLTRNGEPIK